MFQLKSILEVVYSVGNTEKVKHFFCDYGGWDIVNESLSDKSVLNYWNLDEQTDAQEFLLQSNNHPTGKLRLVKFNNIEQEYIRSSQQPWDVGGIMDINLRVHEVAGTFDELRELGWHGLSDPLLQVMGPFELYDILMKGYDDTIVAFTHRVKPEMLLEGANKLPTHVYNSSITVSSLEDSRHFFVNQLGCQILNEYSVKKDSPQETMFGLPFNMADKVTAHANILSFDGTRDTIFQLIEFEGVTGKNFADKALPPNRGFMTYRVEVAGIREYYNHLVENGTPIYKKLQKIAVEPYGSVDAFAVRSPDGVWMTFLELK